MRALSGRELNQQHAALVRAGASPEFTLRWLRDEVALWERDRKASGHHRGGGTPGDAGDGRTAAGGAPRSGRAHREGPSR